MVHFNWTQLLPGVGHDPNYIALATATVVGAGLVLLSIAGRVALGSGEKAVVPSDKFSLKGILEVITEFIVSLVDMVIGEEGRHFVPLFAAMFLYILINNFVGLIPGMTPATDNLNTTVAVGLFSFIAYNIYGFKEHGISYLKQFLGPMLLLAPLMIIIELISHIVRPISLGLRLQGNMIGDHTVLGIFLDLVPYGVPVIFYGLGVFVCMIQAFVFTLLSMIYVSMAISHDH
ncbi:MAG: F0F1 ATP synthase subunit A [Bdellovibrionales bacterium]|nr:F0F1 ATP synthase subunit A [Bdellovibrionales bacterium]